MTELLVVILHDTERLPDLLDAWSQIEIPGVTLLPSIGGYQARNWLSRLGLGGLARLFDQIEVRQRTLISLIDDQDLLERAISTADHIIKGFDRPHSGILFTIPVGKVMGLQKWGRQKEYVSVSEEDVGQIDRGRDNLIAWIRETTGQKDIDKFATIPVSNILRVYSLEPVMCQSSTPIKDMVGLLLSKSGLSSVCIVNKENRLIGLVHIHSIADATLVCYVPEVFVDNVMDYEKIISFSEKGRQPIASDIMIDPVYVHETDDLDKALQVMRVNKMEGLPVIDEHYRVVGYVNLLGIMAVCLQSDRSV